MDNYFTKKEQIVILVVALVLFLFLGFKFSNKDQGKIRADQNSDLLLIEREPEEVEDEKDPIKEEPQEIMIHISGAVNRPGIVVIEAGKRLIDGVEEAGGLKKEADLDKINLAKILQDEDKIYIPKIGQDLAEENIPVISSSQTISAPQGKMDINSCSKEELMTLPGIGEVTANKILDHRSTTTFKKIEDIMEVSGIGDKKFQAIKDSIIAR